MFKIQLDDGFFKNKSGRIQHFSNKEKANAKIQKLGEIAAGATVIESKARTTTAKTEKPKEIATDTKIVRGKTKKAAVKSEKPDESASKKGKKKKRNQ
jgi:hypothetical protein